MLGLKDTDERQINVQGEQMMLSESFQSRLNKLESVNEQIEAVQKQLEAVQNDGRFDAFGEQFNVLEERVYELEETQKQSVAKEQMEAVHSTVDVIHDSYSKRIEKLEANEVFAQKFLALDERIVLLESSTMLPGLEVTLQALKAEMPTHKHQVNEVRLANESHPHATAELAYMLIDRLERGDFLPAAATNSLLASLSGNDGLAKTVNAARMLVTPSPRLVRIFREPRAALEQRAW